MRNTIIFDLDGTLLNTLTDLANATNYALRTHHLPERTEQEVRGNLGRGYRFLLTHSAPEGTSEETIDQLLATFQPYYEAHCLDATAPYDGILPLLAELKRRGVKMAIVSNKGDAAVKTLARQLFGGLIEIAVGESENVRRKPNPDTVLAAMRELGSAKEECVYVGDSEVDFATACNAEIPCISCLWGFRDEDFLREQGANIFVRKPEEVLAVFSGLQ